MSDIIRVLQLSTHDEECGIAKYLEQFLREIGDFKDIRSEYFEYSPNVTKKMSEGQFKEVLKELDKKLESFDVLHIQHEFSFFFRDELERFVKVAKSRGVRVVVTVHTAPAAQIVTPRLGGLGPKSWLHFSRQKISQRRFILKYINPLLLADTVVVHNVATKQDLINYGISENKITVIKIPVPKISKSGVSTEIRDNLHVKDGDVVYCSVGFMSRMKGVDHAIKALAFLPDNYKLAVIGGMHPHAENQELYDELTDLVLKLDLEDRVYITGYVAEDERLNNLIAECDVCVYPYDKKYYSYVSSAAINNALANYKPVISYQTKTFLEINAELPVVNFTRSSNYYELARELKTLDVKQAAIKSEQYADKYSYDKQAENFVNIYRR